VTYQEVKKGVLKRTRRRELGLFIDGTGLDRATRRIKRKVDIPSLVRGVTAGTVPAIVRYYTLIPYEDDARQLAFLDAVRRAGVRVVVKRLPPKGVTRQVSVDVEMSSDIVAFALGHKQFSSLSEYVPHEESRNKKSVSGGGSVMPMMGRGQKGNRGSQRPSHPKDDKNAEKSDAPKETPSLSETDKNIQRIITVVCPSRELAYSLSMVGELGVDTVSADFGQFNTKDVLKNAAKWIDLSDSETIWRD
jgi:hypothetical protein